MVSPPEFDSLVAAIDYPMFIVTACSGDEMAGCLVGFATQASIKPPRMLVMLSKENRTLQVAAGAGELVVHFLHTGNLDLARLFGEETGDETDKFARRDWSPSRDGAPVLKGTAGWVRCAILGRFDAGDHVAHLVEPLDARLDDPGDQLGFQAVRSLQPGHPVS